MKINILSSVSKLTCFLFVLFALDIVNCPMKNEMSQNLPVKYSAGLVMCEWVKKSTKVQIKCMTVVKGAVDKSFWFGELAPSLKFKKNI